MSSGPRACGQMRAIGRHGRRPAALGGQRTWSFARRPGFSGAFSTDLPKPSSGVRKLGGRARSGMVQARPNQAESSIGGPGAQEPWGGGDRGGAADETGLPANGGRPWCSPQVLGSPDHRGASSKAPAKLDNRRKRTGRTPGSDQPRWRTVSPSRSVGSSRRVARRGLRRSRDRLLTIVAAAVAAMGHSSPIRVWRYPDGSAEHLDRPLVASPT